MSFYCQACGAFDAINTALSHRCAINTDAINKFELALEACQAAIKQGRESALSGSEAKTPNRRTRKAYNEYMRDYMRRRRAKADRGEGSIDTDCTGRVLRPGT